MPGPELPVTDDADVAARALLRGGLVLLPTETVYGLAGRADDPEAVARIYVAKGRPLGHPVIVHVADAEVALDTTSPGAWIRDAPPYAQALADALWPGPMTLVLPRSRRANDDITGGQDTVAIRVPGHALARAVLASMDSQEPDAAPHGVAAPSANRFGRVSPTTAAHAIDELSGVLDPARDLALDGGPCDVGVESTIIDCTGELPVILRPGGITEADIIRATGLIPAIGNAARVRVPGSLPSHYAPQAKVVLAPDSEASQAYAEAAVEGGLALDRIGLIAPATMPDLAGIVRLAAPPSAAAYAQQVYAALRHADAAGLALVIAIPPADGDDGPSAAVIDRLTRASAPRPR
ncbi:MAG: L-threonylcarbamoyladenylate synthase [Candidatus Nanopelagicales bacterium]